jgi:hypothetical protein
MRQIAVLPTGEWAQVHGWDDVHIIYLTDQQFDALCNRCYSESTVLSLTYEMPCNFDRILEVDE